MPTFIVTELGPLDHDGVSFAQGDQVTIEDSHAQRLLELGVITPSAKTKPMPDSALLSHR